MDASTPSGAFNGYAYNESGDVLADARNQYLYDADGGRVAKGTITSWSCNVTANGFSASSLYVLGLGGEQVSEVAVSGSTSTWVHTNIFAGGKLLATYRDTDTYFALTDWLGTKRAEITPDQKFSTFFSLPYGNGQSTSGNAADATEQHFTGKERDPESDNDYFGARYYSSRAGRFMSPDWSAKVEPVPYSKLDDPQTLNLYSYVGNNPMARVDADGHVYRATPALPLYALFDTFGPLTSLNWEFESAQAELTDQRQAQQQGSNGNAVPKPDHFTMNLDGWSNPTGKPERGCDSGGCGNYGARRNEGLGATHRGADYLGTVGQDVFAPRTGSISSIGYAYPNSSLRMIHISTYDGYSIGVGYASPATGIHSGSFVMSGQAIGIMQNVQDVVGGRTPPHIHIQIDSNGTRINPETVIPAPFQMTF